MTVKKVEGEHSQSTLLRGSSAEQMASMEDKDTEIFLYAKDYKTVTWVRMFKVFQSKINC